MSDEIDPRSGVTPVMVDLEACNGCGLCLEACPEPYGLMPMPQELPVYELQDPETLFGLRQTTAPTPDERVALPRVEPLVLKGNYASAVGAVMAGCRHFFGYPITPSTEGAEYLAMVLPRLDGVFVQAVSEVAAVNMMYGCGGAGKRCMTLTSSPGFSLMLEGISYLIGSQIPGVIFNVMRGGPGLGNIAPVQEDIKLVCRGLGHGNTHAIVFPAQLDERDIEIKFAGAGGDGAQTIAMLTTRAAINEGWDSTHIPSYGPESRGGTSYADVHIAREEVLSPASPHPHLLVAFNAPSLDKFGPTVRKGGTIVYDSSVIEKTPGLDPSIKLVGVPCTGIAQELGKRMVKNVVALGAMQAATGMFPAQSFLTTLRQALASKCSVLELNEEAFARGQAACEEVLQAPA